MLTYQGRDVFYRSVRPLRYPTLGREPDGPIHNTPSRRNRVPLPVEKGNECFLSDPH